MRIGLHLSHRLRAGIAQILLLAFVLRALIPVGYMPDFKALSKGGFQIVICTANGSDPIFYRPDGTKHRKEQSHADQPCAFSGINAVALPDLAIDAGPPESGGAAHFQVRLEAALPPTRAGPVLGSRGPPIFS